MSVTKAGLRRSTFLIVKFIAPPIRFNLYSDFITLWLNRYVKYLKVN